MIQLIDYLKQRPQITRYCLLAIGFVVFIWSLSVDTSHGHTWLEQHFPGFWSFFGIISCIVLIFVARWFARAGISQEENYYDN